MKNVQPQPLTDAEKIDRLYTAVRELEYLCRDIIHDHVDVPALRRDLSYDVQRIFQNGTTGI